MSARPAVPRVLVIRAAPPWPAPVPGGPAPDPGGPVALLVRGAQPIEAAGLPPGAILHLRCPGAAALATALGLGLHLPADADPAAWRARIGGLLGQSCHDGEALRRAEAAGCDYALLSPVFSPGSKPGDRRPILGLAGLRGLCAAVRLPVLALGGIEAGRVAGCLQAGAWGVAGIGALATDEGLAAVVVALRACAAREAG